MTRIGILYKVEELIKDKTAEERYQERQKQSRPVVDALFDLGYPHQALLAQRYAVPLLADVLTQLRQNTGIQNTYEPPTILGVWRALSDAIEAYPLLKEPTQFDIGDAQIVSLDLDEVAPRGGSAADRQSAVMYMLARHILGGRFFLMPSDVQLMPERYRAYHAMRIEAIREDSKRLCYEEDYRRKISSVLI